MRMIFPKLSGCFTVTPSWLPSPRPTARTIAEWRAATVRGRKLQKNLQCRKSNGDADVNPAPGGGCQTKIRPGRGSAWLSVAAGRWRSSHTPWADL